MIADSENSSLLVGKGTKQEFLALNFANRHGKKFGSTVGRAIIRGALGGILRR